MGMFKDLKKLRDQGKEASEKAGRPSTIVGSIKNMPNDLKTATDALDGAMALQEDMQKQQLLLSTGIPGTATIKAVTATGVVVNYNPQVVLDVDVAVDGGDTFAAQVTTAVPQIQLGILQLGKKVGVRVDPSDQSNITIDWARQPG